MYDINTIQNMITELSELIPTNSVLNDQLTITNPVRSWIKIGTIHNVQQIGNFVIKAEKIEGLEFKSF